MKAVIDRASLSGELCQEGAGDLAAHGGEAAVAERRLVTVIVPRTAIDLAEAIRLRVAKDFAEQGGLQAPARGAGKLARERQRQRALAGERVAKGEQEIEERQVPRHAQHGVKQRRKEEPAHAPVEPIRHARVVHFRKVEGEPRVHARSAEPRQRGSAEGGDIAVLRGCERDLIFEAQDSEGRPDVGAFPLRRSCPRPSRSEKTR